MSFISLIMSLSLAIVIRLRYELIRDGAEFVQFIEQRKNAFMEQTKKLKDVYKICTALLSKRTKDEIAFLWQ